jgi:serine O-acetyltransferase
MMQDILYDQYRFTGKKNKHINLKLLLTNRAFRRLFYYRKITSSSGLMLFFWKFLLFFLKNKVSIEIPHSVKLGKGALFIHPYCITFNSKCTIGENFTILKGATIGNSKTGKKGAPTIGNNVYIGMNSSVVGGITIGDDVLIAANTFVNFDVPKGAIVIGSPGVIHYRDKASQPYLINSIASL